MKVFRVWNLTIIFVAVFSCFNSSVFAQEGASSASIARSRALAKSGIGVLPGEVAVEEFVNYHRHRLPLPKVGQSVALDTRWGNDRVSAAQPEAVLQIGFTTGSVNERTDLHPVNLSLVIDKSGSMADSDKMARVKESLRAMIAKLRRDDIVSVIAFDTSAQVLRAASRIGDGADLRNTIDALQPGGSTNIHAGLMLGYKEAKKNFKKDQTNRVILLTDGIANVGIVEPKQITAASSEYNGQGIDLSTIGVGLDLDRELLRTLAKSGRGLFHFVADAIDIEKVFVSELQSLISPVARAVELSVDYDQNLQLERTYGYEPKTRAGGTSITLDDMNSGLTQVVLMRFRLKNREAAKRAFPVKIRLSYFDIERQRTIQETQQAVLTLAADKPENVLKDSEVKKNYTIAELAQSIYEMSESAKRGNYADAENFLVASVSKTRERFPNMEDRDIKFVLDIAENYRRELNAYNRQRPSIER